MPKSVEITAKTVEEAVTEALNKLNATIDQVTVEVLEEGTSGILGFGRKQSKVLVTRIDEEEEVESTDYYGDDENLDTTSILIEQKAVNFTRDIMDTFHIDCNIAAKMQGDKIEVLVEGVDCGRVIGSGGDVLSAIQQMLSVILNKRTQEYLHVQLDIGGYRRRNDAKLAGSCRKIAAKVVKSGRTFEMKPMSSSDRRIVHAALQSFKGVNTRSIGQGEERRVVIAPDLDE